MAKMKPEELIADFQQMYQEGWRYEWGKAERGCVDCSGAFVYAYRKHGHTIAHGSNTIGGKYVSTLLPINQAMPGMAAFKIKDWTDNDKGNKWYGQEPGNISHIGLVDQNTGYVLNAKGKDYPFSRDKLSERNGWDFVAYLNDVDYNGGGGEPVEVTISGGKVTSPVNMRLGPSRKTEIIETIPQGSKAELLSEEGEWDSIKFDGIQGYVMAEYVHKGSQPEPGPGPEPSGRTVTVDRDMLEYVYNVIGAMLG